MVRILGRRLKKKYEVVESQEDDFELPNALPKKKVFSRQCLLNSLFTSTLILIYFAPSICLTFYQRKLFQDFKFPLTTVLIHMIVKYLLAAMVRAIFALRYGKNRITSGWKDYLIAVAPTGIFSGIDIAFSNWGLELLTISLYTMTKSTTIIFILGFAILFKLEKKSWSLCVTVVMISIGLILFTYKSTQFNITGFTLVLVASISSGLRWTCVQLLLQKSKMGMRNPVDMIYHMQPFMIASLFPFILAVEASGFVKLIRDMHNEKPDEVIGLVVKILIGAFIAFFMEISEVMVVTYTSSLTLSIAGIFKEIFMLFLAVEINGDQMSPLNLFGLFVCLCGISSHVVHKIRTTQMQTSPKSYEFDASDHGYDKGLGESLIERDVDQMSVSTDSDGEHDSQVLFNILNRHDRKRRETWKIIGAPLFEVATALRSTTRIQNRNYGGQVVHGRPWGFRRIWDMCTGTVDFVILFFKSMFGLDQPAVGGRSRYGGPGGGGGGGNGGGNDPRPPRRIGRITTIQDCSVPGGG